MNTDNSNLSENPKEDGKVQPIRLNKEELEKRKETGYSTDKESQKNPREKNGESNKPDNNEQTDYDQ